MGRFGAPRISAFSTALVLTLAFVLAAAPLASGENKPGRETPRAPVPAAVTAKAGRTGTIARVDWRPAPGAVSYRIWRSARALAGFEPVGSTATTSFIDVSGVPNRTYYYQVTTLLPNGDESVGSTPTAGVTPDWNQSPHATYGKGNLCMTCHGQHDSANGARGGEAAVCYSCHDGQGANTNVKDDPRDSFALSSGHAVEEASRTADMTNACSSCHSPHADPRKRPGLYAKRIKTVTVTGGNSLCAACHDKSSSWSPKYPRTGTVVRDGKGYPVLGTFPGPAVYAATAKSGHAGVRGAVKAPAGDCLMCHAAHRGPNEYDGLLQLYRPSSAGTVAEDQSSGSYAQLCLNCHHGGATWPKLGAADIGRYVTRRDGTSYAGHSIVTSGGTLPVGAPIPCYDCHNPHGSARGNASLLSDALGGKLGTGRPAAVRAFCLSCHSSGDGKVWDSVRGRYAAVGKGVFEGLRRDGTGGNLLRLSRRTEAHLSVADESCYACHGSDYASAGGFNVHAPRRDGQPRTVAPAKAPVPRAEDKTPTVVPPPAE